MVAAVHFFATPADEELLFNYVLTSEAVKLFPWASMEMASPAFLDPSELIAQTESPQSYGIVDHALGSIRFIGARPIKSEPGKAKAHVMNLLNWDGSSPEQGQGIMDSNHSAALFWERGRLTEGGGLGVGSIGSQADAMEDISADYRKWVNRVMNWVRRRGVKVLQDAQLTPAAEGFDLSVGFMNAVYALPGAMEFFQSGGTSHNRL